MLRYTFYIFIVVCGQLYKVVALELTNAHKHIHTLCDVWINQGQLLSQVWLDDNPASVFASMFRCMIILFKSPANQQLCA
jgi:hypothetical protein